jgi:selenocysteine-specific elongation factor
MSECAPRGPVVLSLTIGTAGHIDHGKTALVKLLTGHDPDTLPEERARGMTINLGFAAFTLPDGRRVGIVDVPGHERFLHNMLAGATGIDLVLLVIAADDGVMPQTIEHFHVVRLLGIASGAIVITKTDLVTPARVAAVTEEARRLVAGSSLEKAPVLPVSSKTGAGLDKLRDTLTALANGFVRPETNGPFRMPVERVIPIKGIGTIVAGVPRAGTVRIGDAVELLPAGAVKKVKGIRFFDQDVETGYAGQLLALRLSDVDGGEIRRGTLVAAPGYFAPARLLNARFLAMPQLDRPIATRTAIRLHLGTVDVAGRLALPTAATLGAGQETYVQFQLDEPVVAAPGDFCLARIPSPARIIGGGTIVSADTRRLRRRQTGWLDAVREQDRARNDPSATLLLGLRQTGNEPLTLSELARRALLDETAARQRLDVLVKSGAAIECGNNRYLSAAALAEARNGLIAVLNGLHDANPLTVGFPKTAMAGALKFHPLTGAKAIETLLHDGSMALNAVGYQIPGRAPQLSPAKARLADRIGEIYKRARFATPRFEELPALLEAPAPVIAPVFEYLLQTGVLVRVDEAVVLHRDCVEECRRRLVERLVAQGSIDVGGFRNLLGTTRKYATPLLEYFDRVGLTRREGDIRKLKDPPGAGERPVTHG